MGKVLLLFDAKNNVYAHITESSSDDGDGNFDEPLLTTMALSGSENNIMVRGLIGEKKMLVQFGSTTAVSQVIDICLLVSTLCIAQCTLHKEGQCLTIKLRVQFCSAAPFHCSEV